MKFWDDIQILAMNRPCHTRDALSQQFATTARLYYESVVSLALQTSEKYYDQLWKAVEEAQARSMQSGIVFKEHVATHNCVGGSTASKAMSA